MDAKLFCPGMSEPFLASLLNILITNLILLLPTISTFPDGGPGDEQARYYRGPLPHLCPGNNYNDNDSDDDNDATDGSARS